MTETQTYQLDELLELESGLTSWEVDFIDNLDQHWRERSLTEKQIETLERIYERLTS